MLAETVDWVSAIQELKEKQGIDIKQEMERLLALDEQYKKEVETNKIYKEQLNEYASKINDLEKKVNIMTKSMMSSSCISLMTNDDAHTVSEDFLVLSERETHLALWTVKRWKYHQNIRFMVNFSFGLFFLNYFLSLKKFFSHLYT